MEKKHFRVGSVAVLFVVTVLCVAVLGTLTAVTALREQRVAQRYGQQVAALYDCENRGQRWLAEVDAYLAGAGELPADTWLDGGEMGTRIQTETMNLEIRLRITDTGYEILRWSCTAQWQPAESWKLWQ